jgi:hypothetical protein
MKTSLIKLTLGSLAALAFAIAPAQGAPLLINTLQDQGGTPLAPYQAQAWDYGTWSGNTWNSWGLGVTGNATVSGGATFTPVTLNLSSYGQVQIEAQALAGNAATGFNVNFFTDGSNYNVYRRLKFMVPSTGAASRVTNCRALLPVRIRCRCSSGTSRCKPFPSPPPGR